MDSETEVVIPAGVYYIGDPCYVIRPQEAWMEWLEDCDYKDSPRIHKAPIDGRKVIAFKTAHGDGTYPDQDGNTYNVDSGLIGLIPAELVSRRGWEVPSSEHVVSFKENQTGSYRNGVIRFGNIQIDTYNDQY